MIHPGNHLAEFIKSYGITDHQLAMDTRIPLSHVHEILRGDRPIAPDIALRLGRYFGVTPLFWLNLQIAHDLITIEHELGDEIAEITPLLYE